MLTKLDSALNQEWLYVQGLSAYGTSEGAKKAWDTRGRGNNKAPLKKDVRKLVKGDAGQLVVRYKKFGKKIESLSLKLEKGEVVQSTAGKFLHFLKHVGEWIESFGNLKELAKVVADTAGVVFVAMNTYGHVAARLHSALAWAYAQLAPVMHHVIQTASMSMGG
jgi:hypothetical protein